jgi:hypothetical protein
MIGGQRIQVGCRGGDDGLLRQLPRRPAPQPGQAALCARCLIVVIDASTLMATDSTMHDQDDTGLLAPLGPVATLNQ